MKALVYVGLCTGATAAFTAAVQPFVGNPRVFGYYLMDEPDPTGDYGPLCPAANLKAESDWIHANDPGRKTFVVLMNLSSSASPNYANTYNPENSDIDLYGLDPYPCQSELGGCDDAYITRAVTAAEAAAIPQQDIVPVYQAFGGGTSLDENGGSWVLPSGEEESQMLSTWGSVVPTPAFDYVYSWGSQSGDTALNSSAALQQVFLAHNSGG